MASDDFGEGCDKWDGVSKEVDGVRENFGKIGSSKE
jgi:hypothetical protein